MEDTRICLTKKARTQEQLPEELGGDVGRIKLSTLGRLKDRFFSFWNSDPRTNEKIRNAAEAATDYLVDRLW